MLVTTEWMRKKYREFNEKYFEILNINKEDIINAIKDSSYISDEWLTIRNPMYISLILCIFYFQQKALYLHPKSYGKRDGLFP